MKTNATVRDGRLLIAQCLYCPDGKGTIEVDFSKILAQPKTDGMVDIDLRTRDCPRLFVFEGDPGLTRPCPHVLDLSVYGAVSCPGKRPRDPEFSFYATWKHRWLDRNDPDCQLQQFWWEAQEDNELDEYQPSTAHALDYLKEVEYRAAGNDRVVRISGDLFTAVAPLRYLRGLKAGYARYLESPIDALAEPGQPE